MKHVSIGPIATGNDLPFMLIAGPCQIENRDHARMMAQEILAITEPLGIPVIYKSSYDKANRSSVDAARGIGMDEGLQILADIRAEFGCPVITDVHSVDQVNTVADAVDVLQVPAFLSRQTDLLIAVGETGKPINVKKGQFLAPWDMQHVAAKIASTGNDNILLCERGASFGYNMLVSDMRALPIMAETGYPVVFDATHSVQLPGGQGTSSGGQREFVPVLARAALATGCAAVFMEVHQDPDQAPCDGPNMVHLDALAGVLTQLKTIDGVVKNKV
ncbi:MAG: 3-deoxy-8-phosphooctulonate synthase [Marinovum sp.]|nr:3-deoxy-8-phosphooctulonate synthase [Marinovum sp.]